VGAKIALALVALVVSLVAFAAPAHAERSCGGYPAMIVGTPRGDTLVGTDGRDVIRAGRGNDAIESGDHGDLICAGKGDDRIEAGDDSDLVRTGAGDDSVDAGTGDDTIKGQGGEDDADGGTGTDGCLVERHSDCEADLTASAFGPFSVAGGDGTVYAGTLYLDDLGPSSAQSAAATAIFPSQAEFVAAASDPRCAERATDRIYCYGGAIPFEENAGIENRISFPIGFRIPDCPPAPQTSIAFGAETDDYASNDPVDSPFSVSITLTRAASCP
jgi:Ca2+-binding RTX toxin-like protein